MFKVYIGELIKRGHEITTVTGIPYKDPIQNYTEILIDPPFNFDQGCEYK